MNETILKKEFSLIYNELLEITKRLLSKYENKSEAVNVVSETYIYLFENINKIEKVENVKIFSLKFIKSSIIWKNSTLNIKGESGKGCKNGTIKRKYSLSELLEASENVRINNFKGVLNSFLVNEYNNEFEDLEEKIKEAKKEINLKVLKEHYRSEQKDAVLKTVFRYYVDEKQNTVRKIAETFGISKRMANIQINNLLEDMRNFGEKNGYFDFLK